MGQVEELRRQLEMERRGAGDAESYRVLVAKVQGQNRELQQEVERLKDAKPVRGGGQQEE